jgi:hypothetical protein
MQLKTNNTVRLRTRGSEVRVLPGAPESSNYGQPPKNKREIRENQFPAIRERNHAANATRAAIRKTFSARERIDMVYLGGVHM